MRVGFDGARGFFPKKKKQARWQNPIGENVSASTRQGCEDCDVYGSSTEDSRTGCPTEQTEHETWNGEDGRAE